MPLGFFSQAIAASAAVTLSLSFLDVAIAIAVLKYRLYDIDLIIGKTIVYGLLGAFITIVYVVLVVVIGAFIGVTEALAACHRDRCRRVPADPAARAASREPLGLRQTRDALQVLSEFSEHVGETYSGEDVLQRMVRLLAGDRSGHHSRVAEDRLGAPPGRNVASGGQSPVQGALWRRPSRFRRRDPRLARATPGRDPRRAPLTNRRTRTSRRSSRSS